MSNKADRTMENVADLMAAVEFLGTVNSIALDALKEIQHDAIHPKAVAATAMAKMQGIVAVFQLIDAANKVIRSGL